MRIDQGKLIAEYINNAVIQGEATLSGDYKTGNKASKKMLKTYKIFEQHGDVALEILVQLLEDHRINVKIWAASHALGLGKLVKQALAVLDEISKRPDIGILRLNAEMTLKVYQEKGSLKFY